jgi:hypothetical protein
VVSRPFSAQINTHWHRYRAALLLLIFLTALSACAARNIEVRGSYPRPNIPPLPLTVGVYYSDALRDYVYTEFTDSGREEYRVAAGQTHIDLFNTVLPAMFREIVVLDSPTAAAGRGLDAIFVPNIDEFQLGMPQKTRLDSYEVWIRYNMRMTSAEGGYIADWVMTAYGKTSQETFSSTERGINDAAVAALRDLASNFSISFSNVPDIRDWLQPRLQ